MNPVRPDSMMDKIIIYVIRIHEYKHDIKKIPNKTINCSNLSTHQKKCGHEIRHKPSSITIIKIKPKTKKVNRALLAHLMNIYIYRLLEH